MITNLICLDIKCIYDILFTMVYPRFHYSNFNSFHIHLLTNKLLDDLYYQQIKRDNYYYLYLNLESNSYSKSHYIIIIKDVIIEVKILIINN